MKYKRVVLVGILCLVLGFGIHLLMRSQNAPAMMTQETAQKKMVQELFAGNLGNRALFGAAQLKTAGMKIADWRHPERLMVKNDSWMFFVDEHPNANWEHPARYVLVDKATGKIDSVPTNIPPREMPNMVGLNPLANNVLTVMKRNLEFLHKVEVFKPVLLRKQKAYAVLVSGGWDAANNHSRYWNDLKFIYTTLKTKFKFTDAEMIVLYANGTHAPNADLDGDGANDIDYSATKANLTTAMNFVRDNIPADGKFFFYSTNHGGQEVPNSYEAILYLWGEWIRDDEFGLLTKDIKCKEAYYVQEQCFSGGMNDDILNAQPKPCGKPKVCVMSAANNNEYSWACDTEGNWDEYVYYWVTAVNGKTPGGVAMNADTNGDGKVSMSEAHAFAKSHDSCSEHPVIGSCVTGACDGFLNRPITLLVPMTKDVK